MLVENRKWSNITEGSTTQKRRKLIAAYTLPRAPGAQPSLPPLDTGDDCNAAVVNNSVMSFAEGLSGLNREYIRKLPVGQQLRQ